MKRNERRQRVKQNQVEFKVSRTLGHTGHTYNLQRMSVCEREKERKRHSE